LREGVSQDELDKAKQGHLQAQKVSRANDAALAGLLSNLRHTGRTMTYEAELEKKIEALTPEQIQAALKKYIEPSRLVIVTAGDFEVKTAGADP
jgi:zinc protease